MTLSDVHFTKITLLLCGSWTDGGSGGSRGASQHPTAVVQERMGVAWMTLAVMEMGRKGWKCVTEADEAGVTGGQDVGGERRKRVIWFLFKRLDG